MLKLINLIKKKSIFFVRNQPFFLRVIGNFGMRCFYHTRRKNKIKSRVWGGVRERDGFQALACIKTQFATYRLFAGKWPA